MTEDTVRDECLSLESGGHEDVRMAIRSKRWIAFDLDDTLHDFKGASSSALAAVLTEINTTRGANVEVMRNHYRAILAEKTSSAFVDGRTSRHYRKERFESLLQKLQLTCDDRYLERLADLYQDALARTLRLKPGVTDLFKLLKSMDKRVMIITEGPEDAQIWTVDRLGIEHQIDYLATSNRFGVSKIDGLLEKVLAQLKIPAADLVYVGDSIQRDIEPAMQAKVYAIHYAEGDGMRVDQMPIRVNTHYQICSLLDSASASNSHT